MNFVEIEGKYAICIIDLRGMDAPALVRTTKAP